MKKTFLVIVSVLLNAMLLQAASITDDFNRADQGLTSNGSLIGANWVSSGGQWGISNQRLISEGTGTQPVLYNTAVSTVSGNGTHFTVSLDVMALSGTADSWAGIVFNYQDANNFYWFRYKGNANNYSLVRFVGGSAQNIVSTTAGSNFAFDTDYTLKVYSSAAYTFDYEIKETLSGTVLVSGTATDANSNFTGGYAGVLQSTTGPNRNSFDNFRIASEVAAALRLVILQ